MGDALSENYQMLEELGSGSFGTVYKAIERATGEIVAVKNIDLESTDEDLQEVQAEISLLSTCASSFVTQYRASFLCGYKLWIVMEYLGGGSCQDLLKPGVFSEAHVAIVCQQILLGLEYLHQEGKLHRDIKAANILLSQSGKVKLADFGVAAQLVNIRSLRNTFVGTPFWMAPEVIEQSGYDFKADVWSLGITAMELIHGEPPNAGKHPMKVLMEIPKVAAPRLEGNQYSRDLKDFVAKCLVKNPDQRSSAKELLKHRFIRNAGRTEALQELILRRQEWEARLEKKSSLKYYAETLRSIKAPSQEDNDNDDDWVFDTVKAVPTVHTQKRRKLMASDSESGVREDEEREVIDNSDTSQQQQQQFSTMRRVPDSAPPSGSSQSAGRSTKKRIPSGQQKQPLGVNISFGNSPSTVRQFRRVSPTAIENEQPKAQPNTVSPLQSRHSTKRSPSQNMPPPPSPTKNPARSPSRSSATTTTTSSSSWKKSRPSSPSQASMPIPKGKESREGQRGHKLYTSSIGIACQEILDNTADATSRDALARLAESFSDLETADPEGLYQVMIGIFERVAASTDDGIRGLLCRPCRSCASGGGVQERSHSSSSSSSSSSKPKRETSSSSSASTSSAEKMEIGAAKLVLAHNNPHLKSHHRRRQSAHMLTPSSAMQEGAGERQQQQQQISPAKNNNNSNNHKDRDAVVVAAAAAAAARDSPRSAAALREARLVKSEVEDVRGRIGVDGGVQSTTTSSRMVVVQQEGDGEEGASADLVARSAAVDDDDEEGECDGEGEGVGMDHVGELADVLFERWCDGLKGRWGAVGL